MNITPRTPAAVFITLIAVLALAAPASATNFVVNDLDDTADADLTDTGGGQCNALGADTCTLRAAIQESNHSTNPDSDVIDFDDAIFNGEAADKILVTTTEPAITGPLRIIGGDFGTPTQPRPGVELEAAAGITLLEVQSTSVSISGLSLTNGGSGLRVLSGDPLITGNWFGTKLDNTVDGNSIGVEVTNGASAVEIGGNTAAERNVFTGHNTDAIRISGGDDDVITGNWIGLQPDGSAGSGANQNGVSILGQAGGANNNRIGGPDAGTPGICDGECNVIANSGGSQIGFSTGSGNVSGTVIEGNFIGPDLAGTSTPNATNRSIFLTDADNTTIGGTTAASRNFIGGGTIDIEIDNGAQGTAVSNNFIGLAPSGTAALGAVSVGVVSDATDPVTIEDNRFASNGNEPNNLLTLNGSSASVKGNVLGVGTGGEDLGPEFNPIVVAGDSNQIGGPDPGDVNVIGFSGTSATSAGIRLLGGADNNVIEGNTIGTGPTGGEEFDNGAAGILIGSTASSNNTIGGDTLAEENVISNSARAAIEVVDAGSSGNRILRNRGSGNTGLFIDLGPIGFGNAAGPNGAIEAPVITAGATAASISGTGVPGAVIRLYHTFHPAGQDPKQVTRFIGSTTVGGGGTWTYTCPSAECTLQEKGAGEVTANQTTAAGNSSELAKSQHFDDAPPATEITSGPAEASTIVGTSADFGFSSNEPESSFECSLDGGAFSACNAGTNPEGTEGETTLNGLAPGPHTFAVRALDNALNPDATPATRSFTVPAAPGPGPGPGPGGQNPDTQAPDTTITKKPKKKSTKRRAKVEFSSSEDGSSFECSLDGKPFSACSSPLTLKKLKVKRHRFEVRAIDAAGNVDGEPAVARFRVVKK